MRWRSRRPLEKADIAPAEIARRAIESLWEENKDRKITVTIGDLPHCSGDPFKYARHCIPMNPRYSLRSKNSIPFDQCFEYLHHLFMAHQQITWDWWEWQRKHYTLYISEIVYQEISQGDLHAVKRRESYIMGLPILDLTDSVRTLARELVEFLNQPERAKPDALHMSFAIEYQLDYLLTWNCAHSANGVIIGKLREFEKKSGRSVPVIITPEELMEGGEELAVSVSIGGMNIAFDHLIMHQPINHVCRFALRGADNVGVEEKVPLINKAVKRYTLFLAKIFEGVICIQGVYCDTELLSIARGMHLVPVFSVHIGQIELLHTPENAVVGLTDRIIGKVPVECIVKLRLIYRP